MSAARSGDRAYARAVERALSRWNGRSVVLSPRDFALLSRWQAVGVPLGTVLEAIAAAGRRAHGPVTLTHVSRAVSEAWEVIRTGRAPDPSSPGAFSLQEGRRKWLAASEARDSGPELGEMLAGLVRRLDSGEDPERLDRELDRELPRTAGRELLAEAERSVRARVARHLRPGQRADEAAILRAVADHLRQALELPRLGHCRDDRATAARDAVDAAARRPARG